MSVEIDLLAKAQGIIARVKAELIKNPIPWQASDTEFAIGRISRDIEDAAKALGTIRKKQSEKNEK